MVNKQLKLGGIFMFMHNFHKNALDYLKNHTIAFVLQAIVLFYIGNMNLALETKKMFSLKGSLFGILLIFIALIINTYYEQYKSQK